MSNFYYWQSIFITDFLLLGYLAPGRGILGARNMVLFCRQFQCSAYASVAADVCGGKMEFSIKCIANLAWILLNMMELKPVKLLVSSRVRRKFMLAVRSDPTYLFSLKNFLSTFLLAWLIIWEHFALFSHTIVTYIPNDIIPFKCVFILSPLIARYLF